MVRILHMLGPHSCVRWQAKYFTAEHDTSAVCGLSNEFPQQPAIRAA
jgi:hypothetical protein